MTEHKLTSRMKLILALLKVCGPLPVGKIALVVYAGQTEFLGRQLLSLQSTLRQMQAMNLIIFQRGSETWSLPLPKADEHDVTNDLPKFREDQEELGTDLQHNEPID